MNRKELIQIIFKNIFAVSNKIQAKGDQLSSELTLKQWVLLLMLYRGKIKDPTVNDLAAGMGVTRQSVKKMITILERKGYVLVEKSASDSRALCLSLTDQSINFFRENKEMGMDILDGFFTGISVEELTLFLKVLQKMQSNLQ